MAEKSWRVELRLTAFVKTEHLSPQMIEDNLLALLPVITEDKRVNLHRHRKQDPDTFGYVSDVSVEENEG